ncbi:MAG: glucose-6-phosphate isomerase [Alphaproteobacteria bacterium]|nr:glucose-6-phosphate isomerase [Alphaproteobacteria bacterium]
MIHHRVWGGPQNENLPSALTPTDRERSVGVKALAPRESILTLPYRQDVSGCLAGRAGAHALDAATFAAALAKADAALARLKTRIKAGTLPPLVLAGRTDDLAQIRAVADHVRAGADDVVVLGIGGASLGGQTLVALGDESGPRLHFIENIDPVTWEGTISRLDVTRTTFLAVSRSGGTPETAAQALLACDLLRSKLAADQVARHFLMLTGPGKTPLRAIAERHGLQVLDHDPDLSGRYSVLANVGLLPAMIAGVDAAGVRSGAQAVLAQLLAAKCAADCPAAQGAALNVALNKDRGVTTAVLMVYADRLAHFAMWFVQLWAESLGKDGQGTLPVKALGATDQHSQLQLYLDGPRDKLFTLVTLDRAGTGAMIRPELSGDPSLDYFRGRRLGDLLEAEQKATAEVMIGAGRPTRVIKLARLDAFELGALLMHFMVETILAADLLGVDAFDQPAVELGKVLTKRYLAGT